MDIENKTKLQAILQEKPTDITISNPSKQEAYLKIKIRPVEIKDTILYQIEEFTKTQVFHKNVSLKELCEALPAYLDGRFRQANIRTSNEEIQVLVSKSGTTTILRKKVASQAVPKLPLSHNRVKSYLLPEGTPVPFLIELGVMTAEGYVVKSKYDKFRQINRFLEFINDILPSLPSNRPITILDFGCGKSYLTFAIYHFLKEIHHLDIKIIGLDLKKDVIEHCNRLAKKFGYHELSFLTGDIADYEGVNEVDMVVTLHACDTATDYAIAKAVAWNASVILSVPCCQHELNRQISNDALAPLFQYGLIKERSAALFTDAIRANLLEAVGYQTQILEFIDMEHTPKNILIRAIKKKSDRSSGTNVDASRFAKVEDTLHYLNVEPTLYRLLKEETK